MRTTISGLLMLLFSLPVFSQTQISGTINQYAKVAAIDPCEGKLTLSNATPFGIGDQVLLFQMQGATINESNSGNYGNITEIGSAGLFERNEIASISGNFVFLKYSLSNTYDAGGSLQLVSLPVFGNATVTGVLQASTWNGQTGGVLALEATGTLTLEADIDVSGQGFRGGVVNPMESDCSFLTNADGYHYSLTNWRGAPKGEGIAAPISGKEQGRGAQANGGGGGNDHNAGGGGGSNLFAAGEGGKQNVGGLGCDGENPGKGGKALPEYSDRIFMGGGGGAGHVDDADAGSNGGNGGGIVILIANELVGFGYQVKSNGQTPNGGVPTSGDGQGGGGGGGTIFLDVQQIVTAPHLEANGGNGGSANNPSNRCFGVGGGGSGGAITSLPVFDTDLFGGQPGINTNPSSECNDPSNGADEGEEGAQTAFSTIPSNTQEIAETAVLQQPVSATACEGAQVTFSFLLDGENLDYTWQVNDGTGWENVQPDASVTGVFSQNLTYFDPGLGMDGWQVRCLVTGPCTDDILSLAATLTVIPAMQADFSFANTGGGAVQFTNLSVNADSYFWDFGDSFTSTDEDPGHTYANFGPYTVTLTIFSACGQMTITEVINVSAPPSAAFSVDVTAGCAPLIVQFFNQSSVNADGFQWAFPGGIPATSSNENPSVAYPTPGTYPVTLIVSNMDGNDTLTLQSLVTVDGPPQPGFNTAVDFLTVQFINLSQNATGGFLWDFGDSQTSTDVSPQHTYATEGYYDVTLTAFNACGETVLEQTVATGIYPLANFSAQTNGTCAPAIFAFTDQSSGTNLTAWQWEFEGGDPAFSFQQNPVVVYSAPGIYDVKLTVTNAVGSHTTILEDFAVVDITPEADFSFTVNELAAAFFNNSIGGNSIIWDFGDSQTSTDPAPLHIYQSGGVYNVTLTVANSSCGSSISKEVFIDVSASGEAVEGGFSIFPNPTSGMIFIKNAASPSANRRAVLTDLAGRVLRSETINHDYEMDLTGLAAGPYLLKMESENGVQTMMVFMASKPR